MRCTLCYDGFRQLLLALLLLVAPAGPLGAQAPTLVSDLDPQADPTFNGYTRPLVQFDGAMYFWGSDPVAGTELWKSDGTASGTELVAEICPGRCSSSPNNDGVAVVEDKFFFRACDEVQGCQLWKSDGTFGGTKVVRPFHVPDGFASDDLPSHLTAWRGDAYFLAYDPAYGIELWRSDGTREGTAVVKDIRPGRDGHLFADILPARDQIFLTSGREIWTSDGTESGTRLVVTLPEGRFLGFRGAVLDDVLVTDASQELWRSDGTVEGTFKLRDVVGTIWRSFPIGEYVYFFEDLGAGGNDLWRTDGTVGGTLLLERGLHGSGFQDIVEFLGEAFFHETRALWRSDGFPSGSPLSAPHQGTREVIRFDGVVGSLVVAGDTLYFRHYDGVSEIWKSLGTAESTGPFLDASNGFFEDMMAFDERLAIRIGRHEQGEELALVDGAGVPAYLTDGVDPGSGDPSDLTDAGSRLLLASGDDVYALTPESPGAELVASFPVASGFTRGVDLVRVQGGTFAFTDEDGLWFLGDAGSAPVQVLLQPLPQPIPERSVASGKELFFLLGTDLYRSDGTPEGTGIAASGLPRLPFCIDLSCRIPSADVQVFGSSILVVHDTVLARADLETGLFETLFDVRTLPGCTGQTPDDGTAFCEVDDLAVGDDRVWFTTAGNIVPLELRMSDGTPQGTVRVRELHPPPTGDHFIEPTIGRARSLPFGEPTVLGERLYFVLQDPEIGEELWTSDGTAAGTTVVRDLFPGPSSSLPRHLRAVGDRLVFGADDGVHGHELWTSDGTEAGTMLVADVNPGVDSSFPGPFTEIDGRVVFGAAGAEGREPWRSDLTAEGTWIVADLNEQRASSDPREFTVFGEAVYMNAATAASGYELFSFPLTALGPPPPPPPPPPPCENCLVDGQFKVTVDVVDHNGNRTSGHPVAFDDNNLFFWFFGPQNLELVVKVLDGRAFNDHYWVFYGALSDVEYTITVENLGTGEVRSYHNPAGNICGNGDTRAFLYQGGTGGGLATLETTLRPGSKKTTCGPGGRSLCLLDGRFRVDVDWRDPNGVTGNGQGVPLTDKTGAFWFFGPENLELVVKVLDGRDFNGRYWFFYGGLSNVEYTIMVTDTETGQQRSYTNAAGELCGRGDTRAF